MVQKTPFSQALADHKVSAVLIDVDLYRIHSGMAVETDYIIRVEYKNITEGKCDQSFEPFTLSKTFHHFRAFAKQLKTISDGAIIPMQQNNVFAADQNMKKLRRYCEVVLHLIESQRHQYIGKVNYKYVKVLAKKRSHIVQEILDATLSHFPTDMESSQFSFELWRVIETLFLTDHCLEIDDPPNAKAKSTVAAAKDSPHTPPKKESFDQPMGTPSTPVVPMTQKNRSSLIVRTADLNELEEVGKDANLMLDNERPQSDLVPSYSTPIPTFNSSGSKVSDLFESNPIVFAVMTLGLIIFLRRISTISLTLDLDVFLLFIWAAFCIGLHSPRPMITGIDKNFGPPPYSPSRASDVHGRKLLQKMSMEMAQQTPTGMSDSMSINGDGDSGIDVANESQSPLPVFPKGAALGSHFNCWSQPVCDNFHVRGPKYLKDRVKIESDDFLWPVRGVDLFLTDTAPENVGRFSGIMGGRLRDVPTFIINFRLPWGVLLAYFEIPDTYIPFIRAGHDPGFDKTTLTSTNSMSPAQRCVSRYCQSSAEEKDKLLKIVPGVVDGPWVVKSVVGSKPAIIGTKLPVGYVYQKEEEGKAMYLEMDLDIVASSAARGCLSVVRTYTNVLTIDLGFVVQGNKEDELPEQMLAGIRIHGIDPLNAPALPVSQEHYMSNLEAAARSIDEDSE